MKIRLISALILVVPLHFLSSCSLLKANSKIAFMGDSITQLWWYPAANLGYHGDTTARMLARFPRQVPAHGYTTVVIQGGGNDVLLGIDPETTLHNLEEMGRQTVDLHAEPVLCEITPIFHSFISGDTKDYKPHVLDLNRRIAQLAAEHHWKLIDYYTPLLDHPNYFSDGVHPTRSGYVVMVVAARRTLSQH